MRLKIKVKKMKKQILVSLLAIMMFSSIALAVSTSIVGTTSQTDSVKNNMHSICVDSSGNKHITWRPNQNTIMYAKLDSSGVKLFEKTLSNYPATKNVPSIDCYGNNVAIVTSGYHDTDNTKPWYDLTWKTWIFSSADGGNTFTTSSNPAVAYNDIQIEILGNRIYLTYTDRSANLWLARSFNGVWQPNILVDSGVNGNGVKSGFTFVADGTGTNTDKLRFAYVKLGEVYYKQSNNGGNTIQVTPTKIFPSNVGTNYDPSINMIDGKVYVSTETMNSALGTDSIRFRFYNGTNWEAIDTIDKSPVGVCYGTVCMPKYKTWWSVVGIKSSGEPVVYYIKYESGKYDLMYREQTGGVWGVKTKFSTTLYNFAPSGIEGVGTDMVWTDKTSSKLMYGKI